MLYNCELVGEYIQMLVEDAVMASQGCLRDEDGWVYDPNLDTAQKVGEIAVELASFIQTFAIALEANDKLHEYLGIAPTVECMCNAMAASKEELKGEWAWLD